MKTMKAAVFVEAGAPLRAGSDRGGLDLFANQRDGVLKVAITP